MRSRGAPGRDAGRGPGRDRRARRGAVVGAVLAGIVLAAAAGCARRSSPEAHDVAIQDFAYRPATLTVARGDTIVWSNQDIVPHTATARDGAWDSGSVSADSTWQLVAVTPGRHPYYCVFHPNMEGTIEVR